MPRPERRLYREHKYVTFVLNELDKNIGKADFRDALQTKQIESDLETVINLLRFHAQHEDEKIHALLKKHGSEVFKEIEADHHSHATVFSHLKVKLKEVSKAKTDAEKINYGYQFYLNYRKFLAENLEHLHQEETVLMPELIRLCTKQELESIDNPVYQEMTPDQLVGMLETLFPVLNPDDKEYFIADLINAVPLKVRECWQSIARLLTVEEIEDMACRLELINELVEGSLEIS
ncbi:MAG: hemerythrin domain-containing protein [Tatlockia sp.]|nr:hemerythrin domain-containing protein [Tatlockia sp.]